MNIAFCIGNGKSRSKFDLTKLKNVGPTYGCNQLIETFDLDNTIIVDKDLLIEYISRGYNKKTNIFTRKRYKNLIEADNLYFLDDPIVNPNERWQRELNWNSGPHALNLAAKNGADIIIMIGYDLYTNSIYSNRTVDPTIWIHQLNYCFEQHSDIQFVQIQVTKWVTPSLWKLDNFSKDSFKNLDQLILDNQLT